MYYPNYFNVSLNGIMFQRFGNRNLPAGPREAIGYKAGNTHALYAKDWNAKGERIVGIYRYPASPARLQAPISRTMAPTPGPNSVMPYGTNTVFMPTRSMNALLPINTLVPTGFIPYSENIIPPQVLLSEPVLRLPEPKPQDLLKLNEYLPDESASMEMISYPIYLVSLQK